MGFPGRWRIRAVISGPHRWAFGGMMALGSGTALLKFEEQLRRGHGRNARLVLIDGLFFGCGFAAFTPYTILPAFLKHFTDSPVAINGVVSLFMLGLFGASLVSCWLYDGRLTRREPMIQWSFVQRFMMVLFVPLAFYSTRMGGVVVPLFLGVYALANVAWGMSAVLWQDLLGRWLAEERRSVVVGVRFLGEQSMTILCGMFIMILLYRVAFPLNYAIVFLMGSLFWWCCHVTLLFTREAAYPQVNPRRSPARFARELVGILRDDRSFATFVLFVFLASGSTISGALYTTYPIDTFLAGATTGEQDRFAGMCNVAGGISFALGSLAAGFVSRRHGNRIGLGLGVTFAIVAAAVALLAPTANLYLATFAFYGLSMGFFIVCLVNTLLLFSSVQDRLRYITIANTTRGVASAGFSLTGGAVAGVGSPRHAFGLTILFCAAALTVLVLKVRVAADRPRGV